MRDISQTQPESGFEAFEAEAFEFAFVGTSESPFSEVEEMELTAELLGVTTEAELDRFLGNLISRGAQAVGGFLSSPTGKALGGIVKGAARQGLPILGRAVGTYFGGPAGGAIGGQLASTAGKLFGLELEGMSQEDQQFEMARQIVRLGGAAGRGAALAPRTASPRAVARTAAIKAAQRYAPGLLRRKRYGRPRPGFPIPQSYPSDFSSDYQSDTPVPGGRWIRRGPGIVILNCYGTSSSTQPSSGEPSLSQLLPQGDQGDEGVTGD